MQNQVDIRNYRVLDKDIAEFGQKLHGSGKYEEIGFAPTKGNRTIALAEIAALTSQVKSMPGVDPVSFILRGHFIDFIEAKQQALEGYYKNPGSVFKFLGWKLYSLCASDYRPAVERAPVLVARLKTAPQLWHDGVLPALTTLDTKDLAAVKSALTQAAETAVHTKPRIHVAFSGLPESDINTMESLMGEHMQNLDSYISYVGNLIESKGEPPKATVLADCDVIPVTQEEYRAALKNNIGVDLDELLSWYEYENAKTRAESLELASKLQGHVSSTAEVNDILFKYAGPASSSEEMFARANTYLKRARAAAHDYIWLPHDELCECIPIPPQLKDSYPWGGYNSDYPSRYPLYNTMFLNNFNYTAITDGWIKINALHEAYPGHHAQFIRASIDPIPETMKRGAKSVPLSEGTCIRTERVFEFVFAEDPYYPLMVAHRRHHTSTRIKIDLMLHYFGKTIGEACDLYEKEMGFDRKTARAQVQAHENMMGYFTSYYYGMKKICDWEKQYLWDKRDYTELLFSVGRVSMETFENILKLNPDQRHRLLHDYASLIQFS